ncbi:MAG: serine/threonine protein phosphatase, partial [Alphaproteobacteria bacterium CG_4_10_14_0_8_um_filter_53_9]
REAFLGQPHELKARVVFGHTTFDEPLVDDDRIGLDTRAYQSGKLTCGVFEGADVRFLQTGRGR